jgi:norsolorinic acid ketoreductase
MISEKYGVTFLRGWFLCKRNPKSPEEGKLVAAAMASTTNVLITGSNRGKASRCQTPSLDSQPHPTNHVQYLTSGIGKVLLSAYLSRPNHIIIAALRSPTPAITNALTALPRGAGTKLLIVQIDSASPTDALTAIKTLQSIPSNLTHLDLVIANAGISNYFGPAAVTPLDQMLDHFRINTVAPLLLFQATLPLLRAAARPVFITVSSDAGSLSRMADLQAANTAYGASKAAANFVTRRIHFENPWLIAFPVQPGWLQTDVSGASPSGFPPLPHPIRSRDFPLGFPPPKTRCYNYFMDKVD